MVCIFRARLDNENPILGFVSERVRRSFIRILPGNRIKLRQVLMIMIQPKDV
nr:translation initiation factor 1 [Prinsepia uniflora]